MARRPYIAAVVSFHTQCNDANCQENFTAVKPKIKHHFRFLTCLDFCKGLKGKCESQIFVRVVEKRAQVSQVTSC